MLAHLLQLGPPTSDRPQALRRPHPQVSQPGGGAQQDRVRLFPLAIQKVGPGIKVLKHKDCDQIAGILLLNLTRPRSYPPVPGRHFLGGVRRLLGFHPQRRLASPPWRSVFPRPGWDESRMDGSTVSHTMFLASALRDVSAEALYNDKVPFSL